MQNQEDGALFAQFYEREMLIPFESEREGRPIHRMTDFIKIQIPGNNLLTIDTIADASHKARFPQQWARYQANKTTEQISGTMLTTWPALTAAQAMEMRHFKFYTVEQLAEASDASLVQVAAIAGMQPIAFRDRARAFLDKAKHSAAAEQQAIELAKRDEQIAALQKQVAELVALQTQPKRGRPAKEEAEA